MSASKSVRQMPKRDSKFSQTQRNKINKMNGNEVYGRDGQAPTPRNKRSYNGEQFKNKKRARGNVATEMA